MARSSRYRVQLRRRRERKTDYQARKALVVSGKPRLVARSTLKNTVAQIVVAKPHGDEVLASAHSRELQKKYGWKAPTGNVPAAYLTGLLCGLKAKAKGVGEAILDIGLVAPTKGAKVFAVLSGVLDSGVAVPHDEEKLVKERAKGEHIVKYAKSLGSPEAYAPKFSVYIANKLPPEKLAGHFAEVKTDILVAFGLAVKAEPKKAEQAETVEKVEKPEVKAAGAKAGRKAGVKAEKAAKPEKAGKTAKTAKTAKAGGKKA